jgi:hypothetical protein
MQRQVFVLRVWRDPHGALRASLKSGTDFQVTSFGNLGLIEAFLKIRFQEPELPTESSQPESSQPESSQPESRRET